MSQMVGKVTSRIDLVRIKYCGRLPQFSWSDMTRMLFTPNRTWRTERLATPLDDCGAMGTYKTPLGELCCDPAERQHLGFLVLEELFAIYERGPVKIAKGDVVLDLGAHVGTFTRFALNRGASIVVAFEPEPLHAACLKKAFSKEIRTGSVRVIESAAWSTEGQARFTSDGVASKLSDAGNVSVSLTTVDRVVRDLGLERVDFIKADIEGAERHALAGAGEAIQRFGPKMAVCIYHLPDDERTILSRVQSIRPYAVSMNLAREQAFFSAQRSG